MNAQQELFGYPLVAVVEERAIGVIYGLWRKLWLQRFDGQGRALAPARVVFESASALNVFVFYGAVAGASALYLKTRNPVWDVRARAARFRCRIVTRRGLLVVPEVWSRRPGGSAWVVMPLLLKYRRTKPFSHYRVGMFKTR